MSDNLSLALPADLNLAIDGDAGSPVIQRPYLWMRQLQAMSDPVKRAGTEENSTIRAGQYYATDGAILRPYVFNNMRPKAFLLAILPHRRLDARYADGENRGKRDLNGDVVCRSYDGVHRADAYAKSHQLLFREFKSLPDLYLQDLPTVPLCQDCIFAKASQGVNGTFQPAQCSDAPRYVFWVFDPNHEYGGFIGVWEVKNWQALRALRGRRRKHGTDLPTPALTELFQGRNFFDANGRPQAIQLGAFFKTDEDPTKSNWVPTLGKHDESDKFVPSWAAMSDDEIALLVQAKQFYTDQDIAGLLTAEYDPNNDGEDEAAMGASYAAIQQEIERRNAVSAEVRQGDPF